LTPDLVFKDPYFLDFLGLNDRYLEKDLEDAILREMEQFLLEMAADSLFWLDKSEFKLTMMIITLICFSSIAV